MSQFSEVIEFLNDYKQRQLAVYIVIRCVKTARKYLGILLQLQHNSNTKENTCILNRTVLHTMPQLI